MKMTRTEAMNRAKRAVRSILGNDYTYAELIKWAEEQRARINAEKKPAVTLKNGPGHKKGRNSSFRGPKTSRTLDEQ